MSQKTTSEDDRSERDETRQESGEDSSSTPAGDGNGCAPVSPGIEESVKKSHTSETKQQDDASPFRHKYANARASDYAHDFQEDGSGTHRVKPVDSARTDENGIPDIAEKRRPADREK